MCGCSLNDKVPRVHAGSSPCRRRLRGVFRFLDRVAGAALRLLSWVPPGPSSLRDFQLARIAPADFCEASSGDSGVGMTATGLIGAERGHLCLAPRSTRCLAVRVVKNYPTIIPGLRSPFDQVGGLVYFGRMLDKIRLSAAGKLPPEWEAARGNAFPGTFDARCCRFLGIAYPALEAEVLRGDKTDEELLEWAFEHGRRPNEEDIEIWNAFMMKRGWRDGGTQRLNERLAEIGLPPGTVQTMFEFIDLDEGRPPREGR
jgi:hypothetical protein